MLSTLRRPIVSVIVLTLALALVPAHTASAATVVYVDEGTIDCAGADYTGTGDIQTAIDAVPNGSTIYICPGTYTKASTGAVFSINSRKSLKLIKFGIGDALVQLSVPTVDLGTPVVVVENSKYIVIQGLTIDGNGQISDHPTTKYVQGIYWSNSTGTIKGNTVTNITHNDPSVGHDDSDMVGIFVEDNNADGVVSSVLISGNSVEEFEHRGILVRRDVRATVTGNTVIALNPIPINSYQAGITAESGARARITKNNISKTTYGQGIQIWQTSKILIASNTLDDAQQAISVAVNCTPSDVPAISTAARNKIIKNIGTNIHDAGVNISAHIDPTNTVCDPLVAFNLVISNTLSSVDGAYVGVRIELNDNDWTSGFTPLAKKNAIKNNTLTGFQALVEDRGEYTLVSRNHK